MSRICRQATRTGARACAALLLLLVTPLAFAWSGLGHGLVGELAQRHLEPAANTQIQYLLKGEEDPTLAGVAMWADHLRNEQPEQFKLTSKWHYINAKGGGCKFKLARDCADGGCVVSAIEQQLTILGDRSKPRAMRRDALKYLVHFIGDVHQPMHAGNRTDAGGNGYQISLRTELAPEAYASAKYVRGVMGTNLHAIWDYWVLGEANLPLQQYATRLDALPWPPSPDSPSPPLAWARESCRLIDARGIYPAGHKIDRNYTDAMRPLAEQRIRQAAWRLADVLNRTLGNNRAP